VDGTSNTIAVVAGTYNLLGDGSVRYLNQLWIKSGGTFNLSGDGSVRNIKDVQVDRGGRFFQNGGIVDGTSNTIIAQEGSYNLKSGIFYSHSGNISGAFTNLQGSSYFSDLLVNPSGYLVGGNSAHEASFYLYNNFTSTSEANGSWNTNHASLTFLRGDDNEHTLAINSKDLGAVTDGYKSNFSWGTLDLGYEELILADSDAISGGALYVGKIEGLNISGHDIQNIIGTATGYDLNIYYNSALNPDLDGTYAFRGGHLIPIFAPLPAGWLLVGSGLLILAGRRKSRHNKQ
jgi:hypothetical protein